MSWQVKEAQQNLQKLIIATQQEPQLICDETGIVAAVIQPDLLEQFLLWKRQHNSHQPKAIANRFAQLRELCLEEDYVLEIPERHDRPNPFDRDHDDFSL